MKYKSREDAEFSQGVLEWYDRVCSVIASEHDGVFFVAPSRDRAVTPVVFHGGNYQGEAQERFFALAERYHGKGAGCFIDAGANIGTTCVNVLLKRPELVHAYAFEPLPLNYRCLGANICLNGLEARATAVNAALGNRCETVEMAVSHSNMGDNRVVRPGADDADAEMAARDKIEVRMTSLDEYFRDNPPPAPIRHLWIDTQGHEYFVLSGAANLLHKGLSIQLEFWPSVMRKNLSLEPMLDFLKKNFSKFILVEAPSSLKVFEKLMLVPQQITYIDALAENLLLIPEAAGVDFVDIFLVP